MSVIGGVLSSIAEFYPLVILSIQSNEEMAVRNYCLREPKVAQASGRFKLRCIGEFCPVPAPSANALEEKRDIKKRHKGDLGRASLRVR